MPQISEGDVIITLHPMKNKNILGRVTGIEDDGRFATRRKLSIRLVSLTTLPTMR
jgi:hypothetical protein